MPDSPTTTIHIKPYGDSAILLEFEQRIDPEINKLVREWMNRIQLANFAGLSHFIPAYASLTVVFEQPLEQMQTTIQQIKSLEQTLPEKLMGNSRQLTIPVCYEPEFAPDRQEVMDSLRLGWSEVVALHTQSTYLVYMLGFSPGFAFMGTLHKYLHIKRKERPRLKVPAQSVGLAGAQTGIYPDAIPGGWQLIGRTPVPPFSPLRENIFLFEPGDEVQFHSISKEEYQEIEALVHEKRFHWESLIQS